MKKTLKNMLVLWAIGLTSLLPMKGLEAKTVIEKDDTKTEETRKNKFNFSLNGNLVNTSRFWGMPFSDNIIYTQSLNVNYGGFSASIAGNINVNEIELFSKKIHVKFSQPLSKIMSFYLGYVSSKFNLGEKLEGVSVAYAGLDSTLPLNPSITYHKLFGFIRGEYIEGNVSKDIPLTKNTSMNFSGKLGHNNKVLRDKTGFTHLEGSINIPIELSNKITLSPYINYFQSLSKDIKSGFTGGLIVNVKL